MNKQGLVPREQVEQLILSQGFTKSAQMLDTAIYSKELKFGSCYLVTAHINLHYKEEQGREYFRCVYTRLEFNGPARYTFNFPRLSEVADYDTFNGFYKHALPTLNKALRDAVKKAEKMTKKRDKAARSEAFWNRMRDDRPMNVGAGRGVPEGFKTAMRTTRFR